MIVMVNGRRNFKNNILSQLQFHSNQPTANEHQNFFQDCGHKDTQAVIESYGDQIIYIQQPGCLSEASPFRF